MIIAREESSKGERMHCAHDFLAIARHELD